MEEEKLSLDAIDEEIEMSKNFIRMCQKDLDELTEKAKLLTGRIKVMQAISNKLPSGGTRAINEGNINLAAEERFELVPQINKNTSTIKHYEKILECLYELKKEVEEKE